MNSILAGIVGLLNGFLACAFLVIGPAIGTTYNEDFGGNGAFVGFIGGLVLAIFFCGVLAIFISMRDELIAIRDLLSIKEQ
jgi:hypothetical protein